MTQRLSWVGVGQWVALTCAGLLLAGGLHFPGDYGTPRWNPDAFSLSAGVFGFVLGAVSGLFIGGVQALLLQAWGLPARRWLLLNALAYGVVHALADALAYRPLTIIGGGLVVAVCQYLALRAFLNRPLVWLPLATGAWWLSFGLTAGAQDYNYLVVMLALATATGLGLRWLLVPVARPGPQRWWLKLSRLRRTALIVGLAAGLGVFLLLFAALTGLSGMF